ncbi:hypothetical protein CIB48_g6432 [Xylaria polymorpha]|nr:hypothetical protein CIB48_g6432 [Xylaria polymorpha]
MADVDFNSLPFDQQVEIFDATPLLEAPRGAIPNYEHPHARNDVTIAVTVLIQVQTTLYNISMMFTKVAILLEWSHLFVPYPDRNTFWWTCHVLIWINIALYSSVTVVQHTKCLPYIKNWYSFVPGHCLNTKIVDTFVPTFNFFIDLIILAFPQKTIWKLQVSHERRLAISAIFSSGILSIAFAGARVSVSIRTLTEPDFLWLGSQSVLFGLAEMTFAFWVFCIPAIPKSIHASQIRALPRYLWSKMRSTTTLAKKPSKDSESSWPISYDTPPPENGRKVVSENSGQISNKQSPQKKQSKSSILQQSRTKPSAANRILRTTDILASVDSTHENVNESGILTKSAPIGND